MRTWLIFHLTLYETHVQLFWASWNSFWHHQGLPRSSLGGDSSSIPRKFRMFSFESGVGEFSSLEGRAPSCSFQTSLRLLLSCPYSFPALEVGWPHQHVTQEGWDRWLWGLQGIAKPGDIQAGRRQQKLVSWEAISISVAEGRVWRVKVIRQGEDINGKRAMDSESRRIKSRWSEVGGRDKDRELGLSTQRTRFVLCTLFLWFHVLDVQACGSAEPRRALKQNKNLNRNVGLIVF